MPPVPAAAMDAEQLAYLQQLAPYMQAQRNYMIWRDNVPALYRSVVQIVPSSLQQPPASGAVDATSCQLYPLLRPAVRSAALVYHGLLLATHSTGGAGGGGGGGSGGGGGGALGLAAVVLDNASASAQLPLEHADVAPILAVWYRHDGRVDRLRYCPGCPALVAAKSAGAGLSVYDISGGLRDLQEALGDAQQQQQEGEGGEGGQGQGEGEGGAQEEDAGEGEEEGEGGGSPSGSGGSVGPSGEGEGEEGGDHGGGGPEAEGPISRLASQAQEGAALAWGVSTGGCTTGAGRAAGGAGGAGWQGQRLFSGVRQGALGEYAVREDGSLAEVCVRRGGHDADEEVRDVACCGWHPEECAGGRGANGAGTSGGTTASGSPAGGLVASVGSHGRLLLWDTRQQRPAGAAPRCAKAVNAVDWSTGGWDGGDAGGGGGGSGIGSPLVAAGGDDGIIRLYDVRRLLSADGTGNGGAPRAAAAAAGGSGGGGGCAPLYRLKGHRKPVLQLAFCPTDPRLLASSDDQGRVILWNPDAAAEAAEAAEAATAAAATAAGGPASGAATAAPGGAAPPGGGSRRARAPAAAPPPPVACRPELLFVHAGHMLPVGDMGWSPELPGTLASLSAGLDPGMAARLQVAPADIQQSVVQVWRPVDCMMPSSGGGGRLALAAAAAARARRLAAPREQQQQPQQPQQQQQEGRQRHRKQQAPGRAGGGAGVEGRQGAAANGNGVAHGEAGGSGQAGADHDPMEEDA